MNPIGIILTLIYSVIVLMAPKRRAVLGVFLGICYITQNQLVEVFGFHFTAIRMVLLAGFIRILARGELKQLNLNKIDLVLLAYAIYSNILAAIRTGIWQEQFGEAYNILLSYFVFRVLITSLGDFQGLLPKLALLIIPLALSMIYESLSGTNVFSALGAPGLGWLRDGHYRCIGSFRGPHTAGIFGASLLPLFASLLLRREQRLAAVVGLIAATAITFTSNSSGPLLAFVSGLVGLAFWPLRTHMRRVRWGLVAALVVYALLSKAPVWYIFSKISDVVGGDGWYRSYLMEQCWNHFSDWWLIGTNDTSQWAATLMSWGGADLCNIFVACAASAGLGSLVLFILLLVVCFQSLGASLHVVRKTLPLSEGFLWGLGCALFAHLIAQFSVSYYDQLHVAWWGLLAMISSTTSGILSQEPVAEASENHPELSGGEAARPESVAPFA